MSTHPEDAEPVPEHPPDDIAPVPDPGPGSLASQPMDRPIFHLDGGCYVASGLARGPWDAGACHGGAPAALVAAALDQVPAQTTMQAARLTYDLLRPVPVGVPLRLDTEVVRDGRRVQVVTLRLVVDADGTELVHSRALRLRVADLDLPADRPLPEGPLPTSPTQLPRLEGGPGGAGEGFWDAVDVRLLDGSLGEPGRGWGWFRMLAPLTDGPLSLTPLARAAATADFGNGIGAPLAIGAFRFINPDLTVDLHRLPRGEWISLEAHSVADPGGVGLTTAALGDEDGAIGSCLQTLFIDAA